MIRKTVVAEFDNGGWLVMLNDGSVQWFATPVATLRAINREDKLTMKKTGDSVMTLIDWRNVPAGFSPPEVRT